MTHTKEEKLPVVCPFCSSKKSIEGYLNFEDGDYPSLVADYPCSLQLVVDDENKVRTLHTCLKFGVVIDFNTRKRRTA